MNSNSKSLSDSIKKDLYFQVCKLKQNLNDSSLNDLMDSLKTSEVIEIVENQREWLRKLFNGWRLQSLKTYDVYKVANFVQVKKNKFLACLIREWKFFIEQSQWKQVLIYRMRLKREKRIKTILLKSWAAVIWQLQQKQIKNYEAKQQFSKYQKNKCFRLWQRFMERKQNCILGHEELIRRTKLKLLSKYFNTMKNKLYNTENYLEQYMKQKEDHQLTRIIQQWLEYTKYQMTLRKSISEFQKKQNLMIQFKIFQFLLTKSDKHMIIRRQIKLAQFGRWKMLVQKSFNFLMKYKEYQQNKRQIQGIREQGLLKLAVVTFKETSLLVQKYNEALNSIKFKKMKQVLYSLQNYAKKRKFKKYSKDFADLFRTKQLQTQLFQLLKLYYSYQLKKREMNEQMMNLHIIKVGKLILQKWKEYNKKTHQQNMIKQKIEFSHSYRIKKQIFLRMLQKSQ